MEKTAAGVGIFCIIAAIVVGGFNVPGVFTFPRLASGKVRGIPRRFRLCADPTETICCWRPPLLPKTALPLGRVGIKLRVQRWVCSNMQRPRSKICVNHGILWPRS